MLNKARAFETKNTNNKQWKWLNKSLKNGGETQGGLKSGGKKGVKERVSDADVNKQNSLLTISLLALLQQSLLAIFFFFFNFIFKPPIILQDVFTRRKNFPRKFFIYHI